MNELFDILHINKNANLRFQLKGIYVEQGKEQVYKEFIKSLEGKDDEEIEEIILNLLIEEKYHLLDRGAVHTVRGKNKGKNISPMEMAQQVQKYKELLRETYAAISSAEKRKECEDKQFYAFLEESKKERETVKAQVTEEFSKEKMARQEAQMSQRAKNEERMLAERKRIEYDRNKKSIQEAIQFSEAILSLLGDVNYTKGKLSEQVLKQKRDRNKSRKDPQNKYPEYLGYPYSWGARINRNVENFCLLDEANVLGERVIVTKLGDYVYHSLVYGPTQEQRAGSGFGYNVDIIGVTKLDAEGNEQSSDVLLAQVNFQNLNCMDKELFINVGISQELIDHANQVNNGFIGRIAHRKFSAQELDLSVEEQEKRLRNGFSAEEIDIAYITYNGPGMSELVSSLELAKFETGTVLRNGEKKKIRSFEELKKGLLILQKEYIEALKKAGIQNNKKGIDYMNIQQKPIMQEADVGESYEIGEM